MKAVILADGMEGRLHPLTQFMPKPMLPVVNKPVMEHLVALFAQHGVREIVVGLRHLPYHVEHYFGDGRRWGVHITYSLQREPLGTAGMLRRTARLLDSTFVVAFGGAVLDADITAVLDFHRMRGALATVVLGDNCSVEHESQAAEVPPCPAHLDDEGRLLRWETDDHGGEGLPRPWARLLILEPAVLELIPSTGVCDLETDLFPTLLAEAAPFYGYLDKGYWNDLATLTAYQRANRDVLEGMAPGIEIPGRQQGAGIWRGRNAVVHPKAQLVPPVIVGDNCRVHADAVVGPYAVLGHNVIVDEGATVENSTVFDSSYLGRLVNVKDAFVNRNCLVQASSGTSVFLSDEFLLGDATEERVRLWAERAVEWLIACLLFVLSLPLWPLVALLSWLSLRGAQSSEGGARAIVVTEACATADQSAQRAAGEPGWQPVQLPRFRAGHSHWAGRLLTRSGLVHLPKLLHVLNGDIALVGIGPLSPEQAGDLVEGWQRQRFLRSAGLTGLWYVEGGGDMSLDEQLIMDNYYAVTRSWRDDLRILWKTPRAWLRRAAAPEAA